MLDRFPPEIHSELGYYIYRLIDPRDGMTFYVGKGKGDRVFEHMKGVITSDACKKNVHDGVAQTDEVSEKVRLIRDILTEGLQPLHIIHRHGLTEDEALLAEAVLIDATPGLSNVMGGYGSSSFGPASASQLVERYKTEVAEIPPGLKVLAININRSSSERSVYDAVRGFWRISTDRASRADVVLAVIQGICRGVFQADRWLPAEPGNFPFLEEAISGRSGFIGRQASNKYSSIFINKKLPSEFNRKRGMATPIQYNYD